MFVAALEEKGFSVVISPLLEIVPVPFDIPPEAATIPLVFTSVNAVRRWSEAFGERDNQVYAVGPETADSLRDCGFSKIETGAGRGEDMKPPQDALHIRGRDVVRVFEGCKSLVVYAAEPILRLTAEAEAKMAAGQIDLVLFFSARTASVYETLWRQGQIPEWASHDIRAPHDIRALCLSDRVVKSIRGLPWADIMVAATPDRAGMLGALDALSLCMIRPDA
jgi:uroporphyrinogen-III synthase